MHTIKLDDIRRPDIDPAILMESTKILQKGGLVCFPCGGKYRLAAALEDADAVTHLLQSKRRVGKAPALVFVSDEAMLRRVAAEVPSAASRLIAQFWPGSLTILFEPHGNLPAKVVKQLARANGHIGVRIPDDPIARAIVESFGGPLLISSANREKKAGDGSPAQVRKNFVHRVDLFIDAGDLAPQPPSTVVAVHSDTVQVTREGSITDANVQSAVG